MNIARIPYYLRNPQKILFPLALKHPKLFPDKQFLKIIYRQLMGTELNLKHPRTFSEKLQWLKLYDRNPLYTQMVDKYEAKRYVANIIGDEYIIPTLAVYDSTKEIDIDALPDRFVLKCTHDSGSVAICKDKKTFKRDEAFAMLEKGLRKNFFWENREWPYKNVKPRIIAEAYLEDDATQELRDYKFFCFGGEVKYCQVISGRSTTMCIDFFDRDWNHQPFHEPHNYPFAETEIEQPRQLEKMWSAATLLSKDKPFSRIDFYEVGDSVYFGEITFFPTSGFGGFAPEEWDLKFGQWLELPSKKRT